MLATNSAALTAQGMVDRERCGFEERCAVVADVLARHGIEVDLEAWNRQFFFNRVQRLVDAVETAVPFLTPEQRAIAAQKLRTQHGRF